MTTTLLEDEFLRAAEELRATIAAKKELEATERRCRETLRKALTVGEIGVSPDGEALVTLRAGARRFDPALAASNLPADLLATISTTVADARRARDVLAPVLYDLCCRATADSVVAL